jgi:hypothetical protein
MLPGMTASSQPPSNPEAFAQQMRAMADHMAAMSKAAMKGQLPTEMMQHMQMPPPPGMPGMTGMPPGMTGIPGFPPTMPGGMPGMPMPGGMPVGMPMPGGMPTGMPMPMGAIPGMPSLPGMHMPSHTLPPHHSYRERSPHRSRHNEDDYSREMRQYQESRSRIKRENHLPEFDTEMVKRSLNNIPHRK